MEGRGSILSLVVTTDNKYVVFGGFDKTVNIFNLENGTRETIMRGCFEFIRSIAITNDNLYAVSG